MDAYNADDSILASINDSDQRKVPALRRRKGRVFDSPPNLSESPDNIVNTRDLHLSRNSELQEMLPNHCTM